MRRIIPYAAVSALATIVSIVLSALLDFSLSNTWQASVALLFIFGPLWIWGWRETAAIKQEHRFAFILGRFVLISLAAGYILSALLFFLGAMN